MSAENQAQDKHTFMLTTPLPRLITGMALPAILSQLVTHAYNLADTFFVSQLGTLATGAVGINGTIESTVMMLGGTLATGACSYASRLLGAREDRHADEVLSTCFFGAFGLGVILLLAGMLFTDPILRLLGANDNLLPYCRQYAFFVWIAAPFLASSYVTNQCLRAEGNAVYSMVGMVTGAVLNIALDPLFIFDWGLGLGVLGASAATAISKLVAWTVLMLPYWRKKSVLHIRFRAVRPRASDAREVFGVGSASFFRNGFDTLGTVLLNHIAVGFGESALAAVSVANRISKFLAGACIGFGHGYQPVIGYCWGARRYDRVKEGYRFGRLASVLSMAAAAALVAIFARPLMLLFSRNDAELVRVGVFSLRMQCLGVPFHAFGIIVNSMCSALGRAKGNLLMGLARQGICFIPTLLLAPLLLGVWGVAAAQGIADALSLLLSIPLSRRILRDVNALLSRQEPKTGDAGGS